jgi:hypothetical protein
MPTQVKLWQVNNEQPVPVLRQNLDLESRLEQWLRHDIRLIGGDLLIIGQQVETTYGGVIDLLALDCMGNLVILELKRDRTPRDIVAQVLDYASWVSGLSNDSIEEIATKFFKDKTLEQAFQGGFHTDLPDVLNERHRIYIVASALDSATERIVKYLSETHDVDINVAVFAYFKTGELEFLGRSMLLDEAEVQIRAVQKSGRMPPRSWDELRGLAIQNKVEELYDRALSDLRPLFDGITRTRSNVGFIGTMGDNRARNTIVGIYPGESSDRYGLAVMLFLDRLCEYFAVSTDQVRSLLGPRAKGLTTYDPNSTWFFDKTMLDDFVELIRNSRKSVDPSSEFVLSDVND